MNISKLAVKPRGKTDNKSLASLSNIDSHPSLCRLRIRFAINYKLCSTRNGIDGRNIGLLRLKLVVLYEIAFQNTKVVTLEKKLFRLERHRNIQLHLGSFSIHDLSERS